MAIGAILSGDCCLDISGTKVLLRAKTTDGYQEQFILLVMTPDEAKSVAQQLQHQAERVEQGLIPNLAREIQEMAKRETVRKHRKQKSYKDKVTVLGEIWSYRIDHLDVFVRDPSGHYTFLTDPYQLNGVTLTEWFRKKMAEIGKNGGRPGSNPVICPCVSDYHPEVTADRISQFIVKECASKIHN